MKISIIGGNGMISNIAGEYFNKKGDYVQVVGRSKPTLYTPNKFIKIDLSKEDLTYEDIVDSDVIIYAAGEGVQAALQVECSLMYLLNVYIPIKLCSLLNQKGYNGVFITFGSYAEIGCNDDMERCFTEEEIVNSNLPVTNDYALSKRLFTRYINQVSLHIKYYHFILPNIFQKNEIGTRLIPYVVNYLKRKKEGNEIERPQFSAGEQIRQYVYSEEIMKTIELCLKNKIQSGIYNIGGGEIKTIKEVITDLFHSYKQEIEEFDFGKEARRDHDIKSLKLDNRKLFELISFSPIIKIVDIYN